MSILTLADLSGYSEEKVKEHLKIYAKKGQDVASILEAYRVLIAYERLEGYEATSYFLLQHVETGRYHEIVGFHCSCNEFEGQFELKPVEVSYLKSDMYASSSWLRYEVTGEEKAMILTFLKTLPTEEPCAPGHSSYPIPTR
jgi:hypothetical protein